ncbi:MAG: tetratricopeptide repeat protein [Methylotenera sp.]|nr:tetratricopeptide repeat protein [Methylotenera sp.]
MSLINQMLKDLEQRGASANSEPPPIALASHAFIPEQKSPVAKIVISLLVLGAALAYYLLLIANKPVTSQPAPILSTDNTVQTETARTISAPVAQAPEQMEPAEMTPPDHAASSEPVMANRSGATIETNTKTVTPAVANKTKAAVSAELKPQFESVLKFSTDTALIAQNNGNTGNDIEGKTVTKSNQNSKASAEVNKKIRPEQSSNYHLQQALSYLQQGRVAESIEALNKALELNAANHEARLTLASILLDSHRPSEVKTLMSNGLAIAPEQNEFRIALARLQLENGEQPAALHTLEQGKTYGAQHADFQAFLATLQQRASKHDEAINHFSTALSLEKDTSSNTASNALIGLGISLQATGRLSEAKTAFTQAQQTTQNPALLQFVEMELKKLNQRLQN